MFVWMTNAWISQLILYFSLFHTIICQDDIAWCDDTLAMSTIDVQLGHSATSSVCVRNKKNVSYHVSINSKRINPGSVSQYGLLVARAGDNDINTIQLANVTKDTIGNEKLFYDKMPLEKTIFCYVNRVGNSLVKANLEGKLQVCDNEPSTQNVSVVVGMRSTAFFCVTSEFGQSTHVALNNISVPVNVFNRNMKYVVSMYKRNVGGSDDYYFNLFIRNITRKDIGAHLLCIKPTSYRYIYISFSLYLKPNKDPDFCSDTKPNMIFFPKKEAPFKISLCVKSVYNDSLVKVYVNNRMIQLNNLKATIFYTVVTSSNGVSSAVDINMGTIRDDDMTRYTVILMFTGSKQLTYTFYLHNATETTANVCFLGATHKVVYVRLGDSPAVCLHTYGVLLDDVLIDNATHVIDRDVTATKLNVSHVWSAGLSSSYIEIKIVNVSLGDVKRYDVRLTPLGRSYSFEVKMQRGPPRIKSFRVDQGPQVTLHNNVTVYVLTKGYKVAQACVAEFTNQTFQLSITKGTLTTLNTTENDVFLTYGFDEMKCNDSGAYYCTAHANTSAESTASMLGLAVLDCPPLLCDNTDVTEDHVKSIGDTFFLPVCIKAYMHTNLTITWNGLVLSTSPNSSHRFHLKPSRHLLEWDVGVFIRSISAADYGTSRLSLRVDGREPLELVVHIVKPNTFRNIYTKGLVTVVIIAVLTFVVVGGIGVVIHVIFHGLQKLRDAIVGTVSEQQITSL